MAKNKQQEVKFEEKDLPEWNSLVMSFNFQLKEQKSEDIIAKLRRSPKSFMKNINREDIQNYAKEKGIFFEQKQKNMQATGNQNQEMSAEQWAKAAIGLMKEHNFNQRVALKCKLEGIEMPNNNKKQDKKQPAGGKLATQTKQLDEVQFDQNENQEPEKEYEKKFNQLFLVQDFPASQEEWEQYQVQGGQFDLLIQLKEKVVGDYENVMEENVDDVEEDEEDEEVQMIRKVQDKIRLNEVDTYYIKKNDQLLNEARQQRKQGIFSELVVLQRAYEVDYTNEAESLDLFVEYIIDEICQYSLDIQSFKEWATSKKVQPLNEKLDQLKIEEQRLLDEQVGPLREEIDRLKQEIETETQKKKGKVKEGEFDAQNAIIKEKEDMIKQVMDKEQQKKQKQSENTFKMYNKQINMLDQEQQRVGILLECLLDDIEFNKQADEQNELTEKIRNKEELIFNQSIESFGLFNKESLLSVGLQMTQNQKDDEMKTGKSIIDYYDIINKQNNINKNQQLINGDELMAREKKITENIKYQGINRQGMPKKPEKSESQRYFDECMYYGFIENTLEIQETKRLLDIRRFQKEIDNNQIDLSRIDSLVKMDQDKLELYLYEQTYLNDQSVNNFYDEKNDRLGILIGEKLQQDRQLVKHWNYNYRSMPNFENYQKYFQNNQMNNEKFGYYYSIDNDEYGNIQSLQKVLYPANNGVIVNSKHRIGEYYTKQIKVNEDNLHFGVKKNKLWLNIDHSLYKVLVKQNGENGQEITMNMRNGLNLMIRENRDILMNYYTNSSEVNRMVTDKGSVVRYFQNGDREILFSNGNVSYYDSSSQEWTSTNNKGLRRAKDKNGELREVDQIQSLRRTDKDGNKILIREDQVVMIKYKNGKVFTQHHDGTQMLIDKETILVENQNYLTVKIEKGQRKVIINDYNYVAIDQGSVDLLFQEVLVHVQNDSHTQRVMVNDQFIHMYDQQKCESIEEYNRLRLDYIKDMNNTMYIYQLDLEQQVITHLDSENNQYFMDIDGQIFKSIQGLENQQDQQTLQIQNNSFDFQDNSIVYDQNYENNQLQGYCKNYQLLYINNDNTGELHLYSQQFRNQLFNTKYQDNYRLRGPEMSDFRNAENVQLMFQKYDWKVQKEQYVKIEIPQNLGIIQNNIYKKETIQNPNQFIYQNYVMFSDCQILDQSGFGQLLEKYDEFMARNNSIYEGQYLKRSKEEQKQAIEIYSRIYDARRIKPAKMEYSEMKEQGTKQFNQVVMQIQQDSLKQMTQVSELKEEEVDEKELRKMKCDEIWKRKKKKQTERLEQMLNQSRDNCRKGFVNTYFDTMSGLEVYAKLPKGQNTQKLKEQIQIIKNNSKNLDGLVEQQSQQSQQQNQHRNEERDELPIQDELEKQYQMKKSRRPKEKSVFQQMDQEIVYREEEEKEKARKYHEVKNYKYSLKGEKRELGEMSSVNVLKRMKVKSQMNEKFILTESQMEQRVKISSLANRVYNRAMGVNEIRNQGQHQIMLQTEDMKYTVQELQERKNLMIQNDIGDKLKRDLFIMPGKLKFGQLKINCSYQSIIHLKNEDILQQRVNLKVVNSSNGVNNLHNSMQSSNDGSLQVFMKKTGPIAMGLTRQLFVMFKPNQVGSYKSEIQIITKNQIYNIPVFAEVLIADEFIRSGAVLSHNVEEIGQEDNNQVIYSLDCQQHIVEIQNNNQIQNSDTMMSDKLPKINQSHRAEEDI